ncbi:hypothetical protein AURDEDRAFT_130804 [Auricularia subglabra TFB-10046 SS5]|uniref:SNF2 N-terminal domain-containing protein n=1 Tax=Auricularia subglabra (strain TFB-10046 / SS5) TaxID=717982 RepID=J0WSI8_AURST|nr:hypothetical protein AURDEDRAFT_130804 [Auricularia subglabra TFB-10046 SS5]
MADQPSELRGFKLRHHQLAGVMAKAVMYFDGESGLNLDDVGVGKTIQTLAFLSYIAWMHDYKLQHGVFPGRYWRSLEIPSFWSTIVSTIKSTIKSTINFPRHLGPW